MIPFFKDYFKKNHLSIKGRQQMIVAGISFLVLSGLLGLGWSLLGSSSSSSPASNSTKKTVTQMASSTDSVDDREIWVKKIQQENSQVKQEALDIKEQNKVLEKRLDVMDDIFKRYYSGSGSGNKPPTDEWVSLDSPLPGGSSQENVDFLAPPPVQPITHTAPSSGPPADQTLGRMEDFPPVSVSSTHDSSSVSLSEPSLQDRKPKILHIGVSQKRSSLKTVDNYVPAGTYSRCVLLSGVVASTATAAQTHPQPLVLRMVDEGNLPRGFRSTLKDAVLIGACYGDISSERVMCRLETLSWVEKDGTTVERPVEGWVMGEDGRPGLRGKVVDRSTDVARESIVAGMLSSIGGFFQMQTQRSVYPVSPFGQTKALGVGEALKGAGAGGIGNAMDRLAEFSIKRAEQMQPVILVASGRVVDVVFKTGINLLPYAHSEMTISGQPKQEEKSHD